MFKTKFMQLVLKQSRFEWHETDTVCPATAIPHLTINVNANTKATVGRRTISRITTNANTVFPFTRVGMQQSQLEARLYSSTTYYKMRCSAHEECSASGHIKSKSVQINWKLANEFSQRQLKNVYMAHKKVKYSNSTHACTAAPACTQKTALFTENT